MKKALVSLNTYLGSSIALRYVNHIANRIQPTIYAVHVVEPSQVGTEPGSGWVQKTWENALAETGREDLKRFLEMEQITSPLLRNPKILIGDRTDRLLNELQDDQYDLFLEGVPPTSNPLDFFNLLKSRLYLSMPCPVLVVKNLAATEKVALLTNENADSGGFAACFLDIFNTTGLEVDILEIKSLDPGESIITEADPSRPGVKKLQEDLKQAGVSPAALKRISGAPRNVADIFRDYGLVVSSLTPGPRKNDPFIELLGRITSPVLICWH